MTWTSHVKDRQQYTEWSKKGCRVTVGRKQKNNRYYVLMDISERKFTPDRIPINRSSFCERKICTHEILVIETRMTAEPSSIANLASTFWNQGQWVEAEKAFVQVMETRMTYSGLSIRTP
jgi:hypothetical protein